eukprot:366167-Chlamydomonas_euryale.AAC.16
MALPGRDIIPQCCSHLGIKSPARIDVLRRADQAYEVAGLMTTHCPRSMWRHEWTVEQYITIVSPLITSRARESRDPFRALSVSHTCRVNYMLWQSPVGSTACSDSGPDGQLHAWAVSSRVNCTLWQSP